MSTAAVFHQTAVSFEGNTNEMFTYTTGSDVASQATSTVSGYTNGTTQLAFSYQLNARWGSNKYAAQISLIVNPPGYSGNSKFDLEIWSPTSSCSSNNPYDVDFAIGYTSDFYSSGYIIYIYFGVNQSTDMTGANVYLYTSTYHYIDNWGTSIPTGCGYYLNDYQSVVVGYSTVNGHVQTFCMTGGGGNFYYASSTDEGYGVGGITGENSNVVYGSINSNQQSFTNGILLPNC